ncbi:hypothetical protein DNX11_25730, partial [Escherichia coli]|nr:hypothetical protein [Escherichia coli]
ILSLLRPERTIPLRDMSICSTHLQMTKFVRKKLKGRKKVPFKQSVQSPLVRGFYILMFNGGD